MAIIQNLTQTTTPETHLMRDVSSVLATYEPDLYPLDTLTRQVQLRKKATQTKIEWESVTTMDRKATVTEASTAAANADTAATITVDTTKAFAPDDILVCVKAVNDGKVIDSDMPHLLVVSVPTDTTLTVKSFHQTTETAFILTPIIPKDYVLLWIGTAKKEGFAMGTSKILVPDLQYNFCQLFEALVKISRTRKVTQNYTSTHDWETARRHQLGEFRRSMEYTLWFGKRSETSESGDKRWKMGGIANYVTNNIDYDPAALTESTLMDWLQTVFSGNNGSSTRMLFADSYLSTAIQKTQLTKGRVLEPVSVAGISCSKIKFTEGTLLIKHTRAFNEAGLQHFGYVLDMKQIAKRELRPMERLKLELWKQGTADVDAEEYVEQSSLEVLNPTTHACIRGIL